jgi:hypothetical protein
MYMRKSAVLLLFIGASAMVSAYAKSPLVLTDADWLSAAKTALAVASRSSTASVVLDNSVAPEARNALGNLRKVMAIENVPDDYVEDIGTGDYLRVLRFRADGKRIEFLSGSVYPKVYEAGDCRVTSHFFLALNADGEWKQEGPTKISVCARH